MFKSAIVKLTARCDLDCTYCYMFNQADRTYTRVPSRLTLDDALLVVRRVEEHLTQNGGDCFTFVLHGGEPTLWPISSFVAFLDEIERLRTNGIRVNVALQTNAYNLRPELVQLLVDHGVRLGVSLDGPRPYNDRHRVTHRGVGSYAAVLRSLTWLVEAGYADSISGILCVANPEIPPREFLDWADQLPVRRVDVLWPMEFNYDNLPWKPHQFADYCVQPRYGTWFGELFRLWWERDDPTLIIRLFIESVLVLLGSSYHTDMLVNDTIDMLVINTDGAVEYHDFLRSHADGATRTAYTVHSHSLDEIADDPIFRYLRHLGNHRPAECKVCPHVRLCGGGFLPGRMNSKSRLPNRRSVLCPDQYRYFSAVQDAMGPYLGNVSQRSVSQLRETDPPHLDRLRS